MGSRKSPGQGVRVTCIKNLVKFVHVVFKICEWIDRQTYSSQYFTVHTLPKMKRK